MIRINDYLLQVSTDPATGIKTPLDLEKSNVIQFFLANGTKISVRPSGTEPKIKFYFSTSTTMKETSQFPGLWQELEDHIDAVIKDMNL